MPDDFRWNGNFAFLDPDHLILRNGVIVLRLQFLVMLHPIGGDYLYGIWQRLCGFCALLLGVMTINMHNLFLRFYRFHPDCASSKSCQYEPYKNHGLLVTSLSSLTSASKRTMLESITGILAICGSMSWRRPVTCSSSFSSSRNWLLL